MFKYMGVSYRLLSQGTAAVYLIANHTIHESSHVACFHGQFHSSALYFVPLDEVEILHFGFTGQLDLRWQAFE
jgi:hypothetical protein